MADDEEPPQFLTIDDQERPIPDEEHAAIPKWLKILYALTIAWGLLWLYLFWNGSTVPWFDRGAWHGLQQAANTTYPWKQEPKRRPQQPDILLQNRYMSPFDPYRFEHQNVLPFR